MGSMTDMDNRAQRIVAQGIGVKEWKQTLTGRYITPAPSDSLFAEQFCLDGRVVLSLMEKLTGAELVAAIERAVYEIFDGTQGKHPLPIAIEDACLAALEKKEK